MPQSYDAAADEARDAGVLTPSEVREREIQANLRNFLYQEDPHSSGARELVEGTTDAAMDQRVTSRTTGGFAGKRRNLKTWTDQWGNTMAYNEQTGGYHKVDDG